MNKKDFELLISKYNISPEDEKRLRKDLYGEENKLMSKKDILSDYDIVALLDDNNLPRHLRGNYKYSDVKEYFNDMDILKNPHNYNPNTVDRLKEDGLRANMSLDEYVEHDMDSDIQRYGCAQWGIPYTTFVKSLRTSIFKIVDSCLGNYESSSSDILEFAKTKIDKKIESDYISMVNDIIDIFKKYKVKGENG